MLTREEVLEIISYCETKQISYKTRLQELGLAAWKFYDAKRRYMGHDDNDGEFLELLSGSQFSSGPIKAVRSRGRSRGKESSSKPAAVSIDLKTPNGTMIRISGSLTGHQLQEIIIASSANVQS
jgi:hypothetical protein